MQIDLAVKNFRCFADSDPLRIQIRRGFTGLIGVNNSGKSSLLRFFFEFRGLFQLLSNSDSNFISIFSGHHTAFQLPPNLLDIEELYSNTNDRDLEIQFIFNPERDDQEQRVFRAVLTLIRPTNTFKFEFFEGRRSLRDLGFDPRSKTLFSGGQGNIVAHLSFMFDAFSIFRDAMYFGPFRNAVNIGANADYFDMSIGQAFISKWRVSKTGSSKKSHGAILRLTEDIRRIFEYRQLEINASDDNQTMQLYIDGKSYFLPELGTGLSHFIMVLAGAASRKPSLILIDEPETGLHPSLQLDFLTTLGSYATYGVIFSTHNLGLARAASERIYSVRKTGEGTSQLRQLEKTPRLPEFLGELGFSGYQELGFDKILLVEGASEVKTFQQFLRKYGRDHKVILMPLGGNQLINGSRAAELEEIRRISPNVFAIVDSERSAQGLALGPDRIGFANTCKKLSIDCLVLDRRATENYLTDRAVKVVKGNNFRALGPYELLADASPHWGKEDNWRIASEMTKEEVESTELGTFLAKL